MKRPLLNKDLTKEAEFLVEFKVSDRAMAKAVPFSINPNSITNVNSVSCFVECWYLLVSGVTAKLAIFHISSTPTNQQWWKLEVNLGTVWSSLLPYSLNTAQFIHQSFAFSFSSQNLVFCGPPVFLPDLAQQLNSKALSLLICRWSNPRSK